MAVWFGGVAMLILVGSRAFNAHRWAGITDAPVVLGVLLSV